MLTKNCKICGKEYKKKPSCGIPAWGRRKYCSIECQHKGLLKSPLLRMCDICGKEFRRHSNSPEQRFCSNKCHGLGNRGKNHCTYGKKLPKQWIENLSRAHKGVQAKEKHPKWKGGITPVNHLERNRFRWEVQKKVFERDNYTCQTCGKRGGTLHVDHIQEWSEYVELRFQIDNCRTLCRKCHYKITFGKPMNEDSKWGYSRA